MNGERETGLKAKRGGCRQKAKSIGAIYRESAVPLCTYVIPLTLVMAYSLFFVKQHIMILTDMELQSPNFELDAGRKVFSVKN